MLPAEQNENNGTPTQRDLYLTVVRNQPAPLTSDEKARLDTLKAQDPDAWRLEMNKHDQAYQDQKMREYDEALSREAEKRNAMTAKEKTEQALSTFNTEHGVEITEDMLEFDVPPRIKSGFEDLTSAEFLSAAKEYLMTTKVIEEVEPPAGDLGGKPPANKEGEIIKKDVSYEEFGA